ncbi:unnamed protein product [Psylliodes chrysocephalus]|uniref:Uncharacterized protein n=1 Tax=Psylliodes chrysocephalus TaxID=3402493 RepID=A0A9P0G564_9CUCU|nr:unnamed protein product [Psylliodes chrysocephala]
MFLHTFDLGKTAVWNWKHSAKEKLKTIRENNKSATNSTSTKKVRKNPFQKENDSLKEFIERLPKMEFHYCRNETSKYYLLPEWTSKMSLYDYYVSDWCSSNYVASLSVAKFNNTLDTENVSLFQPKKDACETCISYKLGFISDDMISEKDNDKNSKEYVFAVDVRALLSAPKSNVSSLYHKSKLNIHNCCAFNLKTK